MGKFGIEADVPALGAVEEFAVQDDPRPRKHRAQRKRLAPSGISEDQIRDEALPRQRRQCIQNLLRASRLDIEAACKGMHHGGIRLGRRVHQQPDLPPRAVAVDELTATTRVAGPLCASARDVTVLGWNVVVDEEDVHGRASALPGRANLGWGRGRYMTGSVVRYARRNNLIGINIKSPSITQIFGAHCAGDISTHSVRRAGGDERTNAAENH